MQTNETSGQEGSESVDERRTRWEGANYGMTVCANGVVNGENRNYGDDAGAHIYSVEIVDGPAVGCSCPHAVHRGAHCKHQRAVEHRLLVVSAATAAGETYAPVAADGGEPVDDEQAADDSARFEIPDGPDGHDPDATAATCQSVNPREWCNGPAHADDPDVETCVICECYAKYGVPDDGDDDPDEPTRSKQPDMGGGGTTGVVDLE